MATLAYHGVDSAEAFSRHLDVLVEETHPVPLDDVADALAGRAALPRRAVLVTFDDGYRNVLDVGMPLLAERGIPAVVFVVAGLLDRDEPFWWQEVEDLVSAGGTSERTGATRAPRDVVRSLKAVPDGERRAALDELRATASRPARRTTQLRTPELRLLESEGIAVGNHSLTHACLTRCNDEELAREVRESQEILTAALGRPPAAFAYPNGDCDDRVRRAVAAGGQQVGFLFDHRLTRFPPPDPLRLSRVRVDSTTTLDRFRTIISGLHPSLHHARGRL